MSEATKLVALKDLRYGAVFVTLKGIYAVKSEYYSADQCQCILLASGEYAHFAEGDNTLVREVQVEGFCLEDDEEGDEV